MKVSYRPVVSEILENRRLLSSSPAATVVAAPASDVQASDVSLTRKVTWQNEASAPIKREESVSFTANGLLYVIGGYINGVFAATERVDVYNPKTNTWKRLGDAPTKITHAGVAVDANTGTVWFVGGFIGDFPEPDGTNVVWKYSLKKDKWTQGPTLPVSRGAGGSAIVNNTLYFFSGSTADRKNESDKSYSLNLGHAGATWRRIGAMPSPRNHYSIEAVGSQIFIIGGQTGLEENAKEVATVFVYNTKHGTWKHTTPLPKAYGHVTSTTALYKGRYIFIAGGESPHNDALADVRYFDTNNRTWHSISGLPDARRAAAGNIIGNDYIVTGGYKFEKNQESNTYLAYLGDLNLA